VVILSPASTLQYIGYLFKSLVSYITPKTLPDSVGYISSSEVFIEPMKALSVNIDSNENEQTPVHLKVVQEVLALSVGEKFGERQNNTQNTKTA